MKHVVITSIHPPTPSVMAYAGRDDARTIVVGDAKTPAPWHCEGVSYFNLADQRALGFSLARSLPEGHYSRKMVGYLVAMREGAKVIVDTDDDNLPTDNWSFPAFDGSFDSVLAKGRYANAYSLFGAHDVWPRGLPLSEVNSSACSRSTEARAQRVGVWQGLADGDPDVDAIFRLLSKTPHVQFDKGAPVVLPDGTVCPYNSQNTATRHELFELLYLPSTVSFRFTDILRSYVAQPIMWAAGYRLGFTEATVFQERNEHDLYDDLKSEMPMYLHSMESVDMAMSAVSAERSIGENLHKVYKALATAGIVQEKELSLLDDWLEGVDATSRIA